MTVMDVTDEHRVDPTRAVVWSVGGMGQWTCVVATSRAEARLLGLLWICQAQGRKTIDLARAGQLRARPAEPDDIAAWLSIRRQQAKQMRGDT